MTQQLTLTHPCGKNSTTRRVNAGFACFALGAGALMLNGCASIVSNSEYQVLMDSHPQGADLTIRNKDGQLFYKGKTPAFVPLPSGAGYFVPAQYRITASKEGYQTQEHFLSAGFDGWYMGNLVFGGLIGMLFVDPATGAMWKLPKTPIVLNLPEEGNTATAARNENAKEKLPSAKTRTPQAHTASPQSKSAVLKPNASANFVPLESEAPESKIKNLTNANFDKFIEKGIVFVDFYTKKSPTQDSLLEEIAAEVGNDVRVARVDLEEARSKITQFNIKFVPTFIIFKDGQPMTTFVGIRSKKAFLDTIQEQK